MNIESLTILDDSELEAEKLAKAKKKVEDLLPVADKIKEAQKRVSFVLDTEGANGELDRLRQAARFQGFSLRIISRTVDSEHPERTTVIVKAGALIERGKGDSTEEPTEEPTPEPQAAKGGKAGK